VKTQNTVWTDVVTTAMGTMGYVEHVAATAAGKALPGSWQECVPPYLGNISLLSPE